MWGSIFSGLKSAVGTAGGYAGKFGKWLTKDGGKYASTVDVGGKATSIGQGLQKSGWSAALSKAESGLDKYQNVLDKVSTLRAAKGGVSQGGDPLALKGLRRGQNEGADEFDPDDLEFDW